MVPGRWWSRPVGRAGPESVVHAAKLPRWMASHRLRATGQTPARRGQDSGTAAGRAAGLGRQLAVDALHGLDDARGARGGVDVLAPHRSPGLLRGDWSVRNRRPSRRETRWSMTRLAPR